MDGKTIKRLKTFLLAWLSTPIHAYSFPIQRGSVASSVAQLKASNHSQQFSVQAHRMALLHLGCRKFFLPARWAIGDYQHLSQSTLSKITRTTSSIFQSEIDNQQVKRTRNYLLCFSFQSCLDGNIYWEKSCQSSVITSTRYWNMPSMIEVDCFLKKLRAEWIGRVVSHTAWSRSTLCTPPTVQMECQCLCSHSSPPCKSAPDFQSCYLFGKGVLKFLFATA